MKTMSDAFLTMFGVDGSIFEEENDYQDPKTMAQIFDEQIEQSNRALVAVLDAKTRIEHHKSQCMRERSKLAENGILKCPKCGAYSDTEHQIIEKKLLLSYRYIRPSQDTPTGQYEIVPMKEISCTECGALIEKQFTSHPIFTFPDESGQESSCSMSRIEEELKKAGFSCDFTSMECFLDLEQMTQRAGENNVGINETRDETIIEAIDSGDEAVLAPTPETELPHKNAQAMKEKDNENTVNAFRSFFSRIFKNDKTKK